MNVITVAYLGDAVYELYVRNHLIKKQAKVDKIFKESLNYVSATSQKKHLLTLIDNNFLQEDELDLVRQGRNAKGGKSKSTDIITYRYATALEYLIGSLYLANKSDRIEEIMKEILGD